MYGRICIATGMPRSGTSWLGEIINSCADVRLRVSPPFSYAFKNAVDAGSTRAEWDALFAGAYGSDDRFMDQTVRRESGEYPDPADKPASPAVLACKFDRFQDLLPRLFDLYDGAELRAVGIVRHPCGAIHSWLTAPREFPPDADPHQHWRSGAVKKRFPGDFFGFDDWLAVTRMHLALEQAHPDRFRLLRYEDLVDRPEALSRQIFAHLQLPFERATTDFLNACHARHDDSVYSVFKDPRVKDRWRDELDPLIRDAILAELGGSELERFAA